MVPLTAVASTQVVPPSTLSCTFSWLASTSDSVPYTLSVVSEVMKSPGSPVSSEIPTMLGCAVGAVMSTLITTGAPAALSSPVTWSVAVTLRLWRPSSIGVVGV
ncbi:hypothetical protein D9M68_790700 [compost metagenome]